MLILSIALAAAAVAVFPSPNCSIPTEVASPRKVVTGLMPSEAGIEQEHGVAQKMVAPETTAQVERSSGTSAVLAIGAVEHAPSTSRPRNGTMTVETGSPAKSAAANSKICL